MNDNVIGRLIGSSFDYELGEKKKDLSVKIVFPTYCQANCPFCFNQLTKDTQIYISGKFLGNLDNTLSMIIDNISERKISLDVTGSEPTFNIFLFKKVMDHIRKYKDKVSKVVVSTNGFRLADCIEFMDEAVDIVNINVNHYDYNKRKKIFGTTSIPSDSEIKEIIDKLKEKNISATAVSVLYQEIDDFKEFYNTFITWAKEMGFKDVRFRSNYLNNDKFIDDIVDLKFSNDKIDRTDYLTTKTIKDETDFETTILKGVPDLTEYVIGTELVIDDDGICYIDYNKRYKVDADSINYFNNCYVIDKKKTTLTKKRSLK